MTVLLKNWAFYTNETDGNMVPLADEKVVPTLSSTDIQGGIVRLRFSLYNNVSGTVTGALKLQYSGDGTNWQDIGDNSTALEDEYPFKWATDNTFVVNGDPLDSSALSNTVSLGVYLKNESTSVSVTAAITEFDISLRVNWPAPNFTYQFRIVHNAVNIAADTGVATIQITTPLSRPYTITRIDSGTTYPEPRDIRFGVWDRVWYDPTYSRWWTFFVNPLDRTRFESWYLDPADSTWKISTNTKVSLGGNSIDQGRGTSSYKVINGVTQVALFGLLSGNNAKWLHAYLTDTAIVSSTIVDTVENRQRYGHTTFDSANYAWAGSIDTTLGGIWAKRTTTACPGGSSAWVPTFETRKTLTDTGVVDGNLFVMIDVDNEKLLCIWRNGSALKSATVTQAGGFSAITTVAATANPTDWGVTRNGNYIYLCHSSATGKTGTLNLKVYNISTGTWSSGPNGRTLSAATSGDGMCVVASGSDIFCFSTYASDNDPVGSLTGTTLREIRYQKYTPGTPVTSGSWSSTEIMTNSGGRLNMDYIGAPRSSANGKIPVIVESGDDELIGSPHILEFFTIVLNQALTQSISVVASHTSKLSRLSSKALKRTVGTTFKKVINTSITKKLSRTVSILQKKQAGISKRSVSAAEIIIKKPIALYRLLTQASTSTVKKAVAVRQSVTSITSPLIDFGGQVIHIVLNQSTALFQQRVIHKNITAEQSNIFILSKSLPKNIQTTVSISARNIRNVVKYITNPIAVIISTTYTTGVLVIGKALITITKPAKYMFNRIIALDWGSTHDTNSTDNNQ